MCAEETGTMSMNGPACGIHAVRENHNIRIQNIIPARNATVTRLPHAPERQPVQFDKLRASSFRLRH